ncbi:uncharacterized protein MELLADRAFT_111398 [Melampsora larici-populina 98AG31]|uniref:Uncharacterized protein n=1 Tax=Melampsora larici-populina (strain 98AG31 / pathotype 3-4-7) TaxID=747676 RepID=F4S327_MELLP|nr:uncharacterized protein MELLADRAFT_111398 [Melampsora larici-populina 98AG31]EGG00978.1 hypothetical protein MELLADRAFT_111398 [Melampsora larici-populina 98AG31]
MSFQGMMNAIREFHRAEYKAVSQLFERMEEMHRIDYEVDHLEEDASNWTSWRNSTEDAIAWLTGVDDYLDVNRPIVATTVNLVIDRLALDIIRRTIHDNHDEIIREAPRARQAITCLRRHFDPYATGRLERGEGRLYR